MRHFLSALLFLHFQVFANLAMAHASPRKMAKGEAAENLTPESKQVDTFMKKHAETIDAAELFDQDGKILDEAGKAFLAGKRKLIKEPLPVEFTRVSANQISVRVGGLESTLETVSFKENAFKVDGHLLHLSPDLTFEQRVKMIEVALSHKSKSALLFSLFFEHAQAQDMSMFSGILSAIMAMMAAQQQQEQQCAQVTNALNACNYAVSNQGFPGLDQVLSTGTPTVSCGATSNLNACLQQAMAIKQYGYPLCHKSRDGISSPVIQAFPDPPCPTGGVYPAYGVNGAYTGTAASATATPNAANALVGAQKQNRKANSPLRSGHQERGQQ